MLEEIITYPADGLSMTGKLFVTETSAPRPAILVFPEVFGLGEHACARAERLASLGYAALACDLHGDGRRLEDLNEALTLVQPLLAEPSRITARAMGALAALNARPEADSGQIAAIGFCFGGTMALELARGGGDVSAVVGFHAGLSTNRPAKAGSIKPKVLVCTGADDPAVPPEHRAAFEEEMRAANADWQMHVYGGVVHSFTNPAAEELGMPDLARYNAAADTRSWALMISLFKEVFGSTS